MHRFACEMAGTTRLAVLDLAPDRDTPVDGGRRWQAGDASPVRILMDYHDGVLACERNPVRYRPEAMDETEHAALVAEHVARAEEGTS